MALIFRGDTFAILKMNCRAAADYREATNLAEAFNDLKAKAAEKLREL